MKHNIYNFYKVKNSNFIDRKTLEINNADAIGPESFFDIETDFVEKIILNDVYVISAFTFKNFNNLKEIVINGDCMMLEKQAFSDLKNVTELIIPVQDLILEKHAFKNSSIEILDISKAERLPGEYSLADMPKLKELYLPCGIEKIPSGLCKRDYNLERIYNTLNILNISSGAFEGCKKQNITISSRINSEAFTNLKDSYSIMNIKLGKLNDLEKIYLLAKSLERHHNDENIVFNVNSDDSVIDFRNHIQAQRLKKEKNKISNYFKGLEIDNVDNELTRSIEKTKSFTLGSYLRSIPREK